MKTYFTLLLALLACGHASQTRAEGGCPYGETPTMFGSVVGCAPGGNDPPFQQEQAMPNAIGPRFSRDVPRPGLWGAIVEGPENRFYMIHGQKRGHAAERGAVRNCRAATPAGTCRTILTARQADVALAYDGQDYFVGRGGLMEFTRAMAEALENCRDGSRAGQCFIALLFSPITGPVPEDQAKIIFNL